jgi:hypothetical protein
MLVTSGTVTLKRLGNMEQLKRADERVSNLNENVFVYYSKGAYTDPGREAECSSYKLRAGPK